MRTVLNADAEIESKFPFKCIGMTMSVAMPPFNKCSLAPVQQNKNAYRVVAVVFDTNDNPLTKNNFTDTLKLIPLSDILSEKSLNHIKTHYPQFLN